VRSPPPEHSPIWFSGGVPIAASESATNQPKMLYEQLDGLGDWWGLWDARVDEGTLVNYISRDAKWSYLL